MKTSLFGGILLSTMFYTSLLSTMFVVPLVLAARYDAGTPPADRTTVPHGGWDRSPEAPAMLEPNRDLRLPRGDAPLAGPAARQAPLDKSGPDSEMIKPGKVRTKTIRV